MKNWRVRLALLFALSAMLTAVSAPAIAQEVDSGDLVACVELENDVLLCDGELFVEAEEAAEAEAEAEEAEAEAEAEEDEAEAEEDEDDDESLIGD